MSNVVRITKPDATLKAIIAACFPSYKGRKIRVQAQEHAFSVKSYWDGGSRDYFAFFNLVTGAAGEVPVQSGFDKQIAGANHVNLPDGVICVQHSIFMGKDSGITVRVNPINLTNFLFQIGDSQVKLEAPAAV